MHQLVQLTLLAQYNNSFYKPASILIIYCRQQDQFISLNETDNEISMVLDEAAVKLFDQNAIQVDLTNSWIAVQVIEGSLGFS